MRMRLLIQLGLGLLPALVFTGAAQATTYPSGQIVKNSTTGKYYMIYHYPGTNYATQAKRYIGTADVLSFYTKQLGLKSIPEVTSANLSSTADFNWGLSLPCGEWGKDRASGMLYVFQPSGIESDQSTPPYLYSTNFAYPVQGVPAGSPHLGGIINAAKFTPINETFEGGGFDNRYNDIPMCTIVKQTGTQDYYRIVGAARVFDPSYPGNERNTFMKSKIGNTELLNQWLHYNTFSMTADLTSVPLATPARMVPGQLVRSLDDPTVYFTDDEGAKVPIHTLATFYGLGFSLDNVKFVSQATLDSTPTVEHAL